MTTREEIIAEARKSLRANKIKVYGQWADKRKGDEFIGGSVLKFQISSNSKEESIRAFCRDMLEFGVYAKVTSTTRLYLNLTWMPIGG